MRIAEKSGHCCLWLNICNYLLHKLSFKLKEKAALKNFAIFTGKHTMFIKKRLAC